MWTQFFLVKNVHQKNKKFSGKCSAVFYTCGIASKIRPEIRCMQVNVEHDKLKHCVRLNIAHVDTTLSS